MKAILKSQAAFSRDHTTILHAYDKITKEIEKNEETKRMVAEIKTEINNLWITLWIYGE